ncbi:MAG: hypothetical protein ACE5GJ_11925 [Gemmatimonadota bacterium]
MDDAFADLWFHGLAMVGYFGFGPMPLYDPGYANRMRRERAAAGTGPTTLEQASARFLTTFQSDEAFEVLHFVPLYFRGAGRSEALEALRAVARAGEGIPALDGPGRAGAAAVAAVLTRPDQRRVLGEFLAALEGEWRTVVQPRRMRDAQRRGHLIQALQSRWDEAYARRLAPYLSREGLTVGTVIVVPGLSREGRFLHGDPQRRDWSVVAAGIHGEGEAAVEGTLSSVVRELCFPVVRRAIAAFESRLPDRPTASRVNDLAATRCGELLIEDAAPELAAAYRDRFGIPPGGSAGKFLSTSRLSAGVAALESSLDTAIQRELNRNPDGRRDSPPRFGRQGRKE